MAYYDAFVTKWATLSSTLTTAQKLAALNAATAAGPNVDVAVSSVVGKLMLLSAFLTLSTFSQGATNGTATHDNALSAAKMLIAVINTPNAPSFQMADPTVYATVKGMLDAVLAQETATPGSTGITQSVHDALLALAATTVFWWQANGYQRAFDMGDVAAAGVS